MSYTEKDFKNAEKYGVKFGANIAPGSFFKSKFLAPIDAKLRDFARKRVIEKARKHDTPGELFVQFAASGYLDACGERGIVQGEQATAVARAFEAAEVKPGAVRVAAATRLPVQALQSREGVAILLEGVAGRYRQPSQVPPGQALPQPGNNAAFESVQAWSQPTLQYIALPGQPSAQGQFYSQLDPRFAAAPPQSPFHNYPAYMAASAPLPSLVSATHYSSLVHPRVPHQFHVLPPAPHARVLPVMQSRHPPGTPQHHMH